MSAKCHERTFAPEALGARPICKPTYFALEGPDANESDARRWLLGRALWRIFYSRHHARDAGTWLRLRNHRRRPESGWLLLRCWRPGQVETFTTSVVAPLVFALGWAGEPVGPGASFFAFAAAIRSR